MKRSTDRILTTHAGSLPLPEDLKAMLVAKNNGKPYDRDALARRVRSAVAEAVKKQIECGLVVINDGELG
jgi:5-methyltetrahydropteroyltriglutamate--homocysteine methyltransferase